MISTDVDKNYSYSLEMFLMVDIKTFEKILFSIFSLILTWLTKRIYGQQLYCKNWNTWVLISVLPPTQDLGWSASLNINSPDIREKVVSHSLWNTTLLPFKNRVSFSRLAYWLISLLTLNGKHRSQKSLYGIRLLWSLKMKNALIDLISHILFTY